MNAIEIFSALMAIESLCLRGKETRTIREAIERSLPGNQSITAGAGS